MAMDVFIERTLRMEATVHASDADKDIIGAAQMSAEHLTRGAHTPCQKVANTEINFKEKGFPNI